MIDKVFRNMLINYKKFNNWVFEMKFWVLCVMFLLIGCGLLVIDCMFNDNLFDVVLKGDFDVCYLEWGYVL